MIELSTFFESYDVTALRAKVLAQDGIDICGVYCLATGKRMGMFDESEILAAIEEIGIDHEDDLIDDLIVRVVASMRPSPAMNMPNRMTIREMVSSRPVDAIAYLANRLHGHRDLLTKRQESSFLPLLERIKFHAHWTQLAAGGLDLTPWIHHLLDLDSKLNLHDQRGPLVGDFKQPLLTQVTLENHEDMLKLFESWVFAQLSIYDKRDKLLIQQASWVRGNRMTEAAFNRSYLDNPEIAGRRHEAAAKKARIKVGRPAVSPKTQKLNAETNEFLHLLEGILDGTIESPTPTKPKPRVMTGGSLKLNLAKRSI